MKIAKCPCCESELIDSEYVFICSNDDCWFRCNRADLQKLETTKSELGKCRRIIEAERRKNIVEETEKMLKAIYKGSR